VGYLLDKERAREVEIKVFPVPPLPDVTVIFIYSL